MERVRLEPEVGITFEGLLLGTYTHQPGPVSKGSTAFRIVSQAGDPASKTLTYRDISNPNCNRL